MSSVKNTLSCLSYGQLQNLCTTLIQNQNLNVVQLVHNIQQNQENSRKNNICNLKNHIEKILSTHCKLLDIANFVDFVLNTAVISELYPIAMRLKNALVIPDDIYEKYKITQIGVMDEIFELLKLTNNGTSNIEIEKFIDLLIIKCNEILSEENKYLKTFL